MNSANIFRNRNFSVDMKMKVLIQERKKKRWDDLMKKT